MGYGPLVRCSSGLTSLWRYPDSEASFGDSLTVYPDHFAARVLDVAVVACLIARRQSGQGDEIEASQAESILTALSDVYLQEWLEPGSVSPHGNVMAYESPSGIYPCAGEDAWCVINVRHDDDWARLVEVVVEPCWLRDPSCGEPRCESPGAPSWMPRCRRGPPFVMRTRWRRWYRPPECRLGPCATSPSSADDEHLRQRGFFRTVTHPHVKRPITMENGPGLAAGIAEPELTPAPCTASTRARLSPAARDDDDEIDAATAAGVLEHPAPG